MSILVNIKKPAVRLTAFIIGNGPSRAGFDLHSLQGRGVTWGCNHKIIEEFQPDYVVAIDSGPITVLESQELFPLHRVITPPQDERYEDARYNQQRRRSNAGMNAMKEAIRKGATTLYLIGFDSLVDPSPEGATGNLYKGEPGYELSDKTTEDDAKHRREYFRWFMEANPDIHFVLVNDANTRLAYGGAGHPVRYTSMITYADLAAGKPVSLMQINED